MEAERRRQIQSWMIRFSEGDRSAFQPLFDALWPVILAFTSKVLRELPDAEDAAQQAMLKIFSRIADFDQSRDGLSWAFGVAGFEVMTIRKGRARRREAVAAALEPLIDAQPNAEERLSVKELEHSVYVTLGELPERDRQALVYAFGGEEPAKDETSRKRRFRAIERLRAAWRRTHG